MDNRPYWVDVIHLADLLYDDTLTFRQQRERVTHRLSESAWVKSLPDWEPVHAHIEEMGRTVTELAFMSSLNAVLSEADYHRCLVVTTILVDHSVRGPYRARSTGRSP